MSISIVCPECGSTNHVHRRMAGRRVHCPHCDASVAVPESAIDDVSDSGDRANPWADDDVRTAMAADAYGEEIDGGSDADGAEIVEDVELVEEAEVIPTDLGLGGPHVEFDSDPVFDQPEHHDATDMPTLPPALLPDEDDEGLPPRKKRKEDELDMTPMVDVTFLLLIFFMVTASFSLQKSLEMPRQQSDAASTNPQEPEEEPDMITVQIDEFGSFLVLATDWERETPGKQNLIGALREARDGVSGAAKLAIEVHEQAKLKYLVDCMDAGAICGYAELQVTQVDGFD